MLLYKSIKSFDNNSHLQFDIDCSNNLASRNKLMLNPIKCKDMTISRKRKFVYHAQFLLNGTPLEQVRRDLKLQVLRSPHHLIFHGLHTLSPSVPQQEKLLICCIRGSMVMLIIIFYLNSIVSLYTSPPRICCSDLGSTPHQRHK